MPLTEASKKARVPAPTLVQLIKKGKIDAVTMHDQILVREADVMAQQSRDNSSNLEGVPIGIGEAARKYGVHQQTISRWKAKGYIKVLSQQGQKIFVNEADVAYMVSWYKINPGQGRRTDLKK